MTEPAIPSAVMRPERSLLRGLKMIGWAFLGIRKRTDSQDDLARVSPLQVVGAAIAAVIVIVVMLIVIVHWVVPK
ncbi:MAG TPA: DUF2970 domain-containing protein [Rhodoferax sp.]|jgi:hypothetical protein|nr:DUF2970 domain-containing protein [Rhodoferax sp.]